jgi:hypothetical protein
MRFFLTAWFCAAILGLAGCSDNSGAAKSAPELVVPAGEKASAGHLTYNVVDSQILTQLGDDANPRVPHERYVLVQVAVTNSSNVENPIPAVELLSDSGQVYHELSDGTGITNWLGLFRHVGAGQTERGEIVFDAPAAHYRLRFRDELADNEILEDLPLSYSHEQIKSVLGATPAQDLPESPAPIGPQDTPNKK